jgi:transcriptional/translational regulatory protein YebC/TACO1
VALIIDAMTDNPVRTVADVRHALSKHGGNLGTSGSVAFQFARLGELVFDTRAGGAEDRVLELALEAGADDVQVEGGRSTVLCAADQFEQVRDALTGAGLEPLSADVVMRPGNRVAVSGEIEETLRDLLERLDELDDVQEVYHNAALAAE